MEDVIIYEYMIANGKFTKYIHGAKKQGGVFEFNKNGNRRAVHKIELDIAKNGRVLSLVNDEQKAKQMLIDYYEDQVKRIERNLDLAKKNLNVVKE